MFGLMRAKDSIQRGWRENVGVKTSKPTKVHFVLSDWPDLPICEKNRYERLWKIWRVLLYNSLGLGYLNCVIFKSGSLRFSGKCHGKLETIKCKTIILAHFSCIELLSLHPICPYAVFCFSYERRTAKKQATSVGDVRSLALHPKLRRMVSSTATEVTRCELNMKGTIVLSTSQIILLTSFQSSCY